jgi:hypothetical protein
MAKSCVRTSFMQLPEARLQLESAARELSALRVARLSVRSAALGRWTLGCIGTDDNPSPPFAAALRRIALNITIEPSPTRQVLRDPSQQPAMTCGRARAPCSHRRRAIGGECRKAREAARARAGITL